MTSELSKAILARLLEIDCPPACLSEGERNQFHPLIAAFLEGRVLLKYNPGGSDQSRTCVLKPFSKDFPFASLVEFAAGRNIAL